MSKKEDDSVRAMLSDYDPKGSDPTQIIDSICSEGSLLILVQEVGPSRKSPMISWIESSHSVAV